MRLQDIYEHFHPEERPFIDRASEWVVNAGDYHEAKLTPFLDPRQCLILESLVNRHPDVTFRLWGGYPEAERRRAFIAPDYRDVETEDMHLKVLDIQSEDERLSELDHGDYLGAILGLGLKRDKIGDIHVREDGCHVIVSDDISDFLNLHLRQVHRVSVLTELAELTELKVVTSSLEPLELSVASLRLDGIVSDVFRLSRSKVLDPIRAGRCRVNWKTEEDPSKGLKEGDVVSFKGFGRFKLLEVGSMTKKGRYRLRIGKFV